MNVTRCSSLFCAALVAGAVSLAIASADAGEVLFEDDFESLDPAWGEPSEAVKVKDKKLVVQPPVGMSQTQLNQGFLFDDVELTGKVRLAQGDDPNQYAGLVFWAEDYDNYYAFTVTTDGRYGVIRRVKGR